MHWLHFAVHSHESPVYLGLQSRPLSSYATLEFGTHTKKWSDILARLRPTRRLLASPEHGKGKAQVVDRPGQLAHILWAASRGDLGRRNVAVIWMLFGSGLRVNEVAHLKVSDVFYQDGTLKEVCAIPGNTTKTGKSRPAFVLARQHRDALVAWRDQRVTEGAFLSEDGSYGGLRDDSHLFLGRRGKTWRRLAFNDKKYKTSAGEVVTTKVCGSLENLVRDLLKGAGLNYGSSHSGRRTLATWLDRKGCDLELIQLILGHNSPDMTLEYIDPDLPRIKAAFQSIWSNVKVPNCK